MIATSKLFRALTSGRDDGLGNAVITAYGRNLGGQLGVP